MAVLNLRITDDNLIRRVRLSAERRNVSIDEEILDALHARFAAEREELIRRADEVAAMTPVGVTQTDSTALVREDRDR